MLDRFSWGRKLAQVSRLFFFKHDVLRSGTLRGDPKTIMRLYDFFAPVYDLLFPRIQTYTATANHIVTTLVQPGDQILDLGAGTGLLTVKMAVKASHVVAMDLHQAMLRRARDKALELGLDGRVNYSQGNATVLPFRDAVFNLVTSSFMEVYLTVPEKTQMLEEIHRVLAPGGRLIFMTGNGEVSNRYIKRHQWTRILERSLFTDIEFTDHYDVFRVIFARKAGRGNVLEPSLNRSSRDEREGA
ncbi:MAG: class I SAM-dependent methyltransferase [Candidatus Riflebacteria bacterium]|nr:class I SAM-dependent methyltransferase [Candidatus Riflebacteria bacterium]